MKNFQLLLGFILVLSCASSCLIFGDDDDEDDLTELPTSIQDFIQNNYPDYVVEEAEKETLCTGVEVYEVELETKEDNEIELVFDLEGSLLYEEVEISTEELPTAVTESIIANYGNFKLEEAERLELATDGTQYEVELEQGDTELEVLFSGNGTVICEESDDD